jgi:alpha-beta hydrolase superfamily lysophospholipase
VFVHGFNGKAVGTWKGFETLLPQRPEAVGTDLLFYGYDTFRDPTPLASQKLRELLDQLVAAPSAVRLSASQTGNPPPYASILLCAHSFGGVVVRRMIMDAYAHARPWTTHLALVLFAPAHRAISTAFATRVAAKLSRPVASMLNRIELDVLHQETEFYGRTGNKMIVPLATVQAQFERWVQVGAYANDPPNIMVPNATHTSISKPTATYTTPVDVVVKALRHLSSVDELLRVF